MQTNEHKLSESLDFSSVQRVSESQRYRFGDCLLRRKFLWAGGQNYRQVVYSSSILCSSNFHKKHSPTLPLDSLIPFPVQGHYLGFNTRNREKLSYSQAEPAQPGQASCLAVA